MPRVLAVVTPLVDEEIDKRVATDLAPETI